MLRSIFLLTIFVLSGPLCAESFPVIQDKAQDKMVILNVRVTDALSKAVVDVPQSSFQITEDGVAQNITLFSKEEIPLSYGLVIDTSGSLRSQLLKVMQAGGRIVNSNKGDDETFLIRFISSDKIQVVQDTTSDKKLLIDGLNSLYVEGGQTAVVDAVYLAAEKLATQKSAAGSVRRRAIVLVTDGEDRASYYKIEQLFRLLGSTDIQIYAIGFTGELKGKASSNTFHKIQVSISENANQDKRIAVTRVGYSAVGK